MSAINIFVSYSHEDALWVQPGTYGLIPWLAHQLEEDDVQFWVDYELKKAPGIEFQKKIEAEIDQAQFAVLLISQDFVSSKFIREVELKRIKEQLEQDEISVIPILVGPTSWKGRDEIKWINERQMMPGKPTPLNKYNTPSRWKDVRVEILEAIQYLIDEKRKALARVAGTPAINSEPVPAQTILPTAATHTASLAPELPTADQQRNTDEETTLPLAAPEAIPVPATIPSETSQAEPITTPLAEAMPTVPEPAAEPILSASDVALPLEGSEGVTAFPPTPAAPAEEAATATTLRPETVRAETTEIKSEAMPAPVSTTTTRTTRFALPPLKYVVAILGVVLLGWLIVLMLRGRGSNVAVSFEERLLATVPPEYEKDGATWYSAFSQDGRKIAYLAKQADKRFAVIDGKKGPEFDSIYSLRISPDGKRTAYIAVQTNKRFVIDNEKKGPEFDSAGDLIISPDGNKVAYIARQASSKYLVIVNGQTIAEEDSPSNLSFSLDGKKLAYITRRGSKSLVMIDNKPSSESDPLKYVVFSPDGKKIAHASLNGKKVFYVVGGEKQHEFDEVFQASFSPDGKNIAYGVFDNGKNYLVVNGAIKHDFDFWFVWGTVFSPDSTQIACIIAHPNFYLGNQPRYIAIGDRKSPEFDSVHSMVFSPDGKKVAYGAEIGRELWWKVMDVK